MSWLLKTWSTELIWWLASSGFFILVNIPPALSQGVLVSFLSNIDLVGKHMRYQKGGQKKSPTDQLGQGT